MTPGIAISQEKKELLVYHHQCLHSTAEFVHENLFLPGEVLLTTIQGIWKHLSEGSDAVAKYLEHSAAKRSNKLISEDSDEQAFIASLLADNRSVRLRTLTYQFHQRFYEENFARMPSLSTVYREIASHNTRKRVSWKNIGRNPEEQLDFIEDMAHVASSRGVDIDGLVQNAEDFLEKYGWSPSGEDCIRHQIIISGRTFAVLAAYCERGFIHWHIFECTVSEREVVEFLDSLKSKLDEDSFGLFDNAANLKTDAVRLRANTVFNGLYRYCPAYSPELKPVENGFSNIKRYIRERDNEYKWLNDPIGLINSAFEYYKEGTATGLAAAYGHWNLYRENHSDYERQLLLEL